MLRVSILFCFTIFNFGTVLTVWYYLILINIRKLNIPM